MPDLKPNSPATPSEAIPWDNDAYRHTQPRGEAHRNPEIEKIKDQIRPWTRGPMEDGYGSYDR